MVDNVAVVIAAYRAERWIEECLDSVYAQRSTRNIYLRIGVDGCEATSNVLTRLGEPHWFSPVNVGCFVMRNSVINFAQTMNAYAIFDADDRMRPGYVEHLARLAHPFGFAGCARYSINPLGARIGSKKEGFLCGVGLMTRHAWRVVGPYRPWRMAADSDWIARAQALEIPVETTTRMLYERRVHPESLTQHPDTKFGSPAREKLKLAVQDSIARRDFIVPLVTTPLEWRA